MHLYHRIGQDREDRGTVQDRGTVHLSCLAEDKTDEPSPCLPCLALFGDINAPVSETPRIIITSPLWAYLKIAEGCDNRCAYCCIPDIRGRFRSRPLENIVTEAKKLADTGIRELILVAQDLTRYGLDLYGKRKLYDLLAELNKIEDLKWIRLHYMYPDEFDDELIDFIAKSGKIVKYLDIPIQHINDGVLKKMNRRGTSKDIKELFRRLRESIPGIVLRTSLITGLPGEGKKEFEELCDFLREAKIERVGVFAYSPEDGTPAALMGRPPKSVAAKRAELLLNIQAGIMKQWNESRIGSITTVLVEGFKAPDEKSNVYLARSYAESPGIDGYIYVKGLNIKTDKQSPYSDDKIVPSPSVPDSVQKDDKIVPSPYVTSVTSVPCFMDVRITGIENGILVGDPLLIQQIN